MPYHRLLQNRISVQHLCEKSEFFHVGSVNIPFKPFNFGFGHFRCCVFLFLFLHGKLRYKQFTSKFVGVMV